MINKHAAIVALILCTKFSIRLVLCKPKTAVLTINMSNIYLKEFGWIGINNLCLQIHLTLGQLAVSCRCNQSTYEI